MTFLRNNLSLIILSVILFYLCFYYVNADKNKYSKEANSRLMNLKDPLRMGKLNVIWEKARKRLSDGKLKKLLSELKLQDQDELTFKKLKASGGDKEGMKEAELRKSLKEILKKYALERQDNGSDPDITDSEAKKFEKSFFKDKKLHKLWMKAEQSGLTQEELKTLKEEFEHHQDKITEYNSLFEKASVSTSDIPRITNDIHHFEDLEQMEGSEKQYHENINVIRSKHKEIKNGYNKLHKKVSSGPDNKEFSDSKVAGLWKLALRSDFNDIELESLYTELKHYETRLSKLSHFINEIDKLSLGKFEDDLSENDLEKVQKAEVTEAQKILEAKLNKQRSKTEKLHRDLEMRILARNSEL